MAERLNNRNIKHPGAGQLFIAFAAVFFIAASGVFVMGVFVDREVRFIPDNERINLRDYRGASGSDYTGLSEADYRVLLEQTGLGQDAVDLIARTAIDPAGELARYQEDYFRSWDYLCQQVGIVTSEEHLAGSDGYWINAITLADVRDGDIFLTKGTHSLGWRHGHAAIVIDAEEGKTLEAVLWGLPSEIQSVDKWRSYPTFIQLRLRDKPAGEAAAGIAADHLEGLTYGLLAGLIPHTADTPRTTQCAHLPWYAYLCLGYDVDSNGGWLVTPKDIAASGLLEIVQIYGVDPVALWK